MGTKKFIFGNDVVIYYTDHIEVELNVTDTSILDKYVYSYNECCGLHPIDMVNKAWKDHNKAYEEYMDEILYTE